MVSKNSSEYSTGVNCIGYSTSDEFMELLPNGLTCILCVVGNIFFNFCVNFFRFAAKSKELVHGIVLRIQLVVQIMYTIFQTGFTHSIVRAKALVDSFPSTIDIRDQFEK
jgi:hypothetical protein